MDPLVGPIDKGVIRITIAVFSFQGVLYKPSTTHPYNCTVCYQANCQCRSTDVHHHAVSTTHITRRTHNTRTLWLGNSACASRHLDFWHLPPLTL